MSKTNLNKKDKKKKKKEEETNIIQTGIAWNRSANFTSKKANNNR